MIDGERHSPCSDNNEFLELPSVLETRRMNKVLFLVDDFFLSSLYVVLRIKPMLLFLMIQSFTPLLKNVTKFVQSFIAIHRCMISKRVICKARILHNSTSAIVNAVRDIFMGRALTDMLMFGNPTFCNWCKCWLIVIITFFGKNKMCSSLNYQYMSF